MAGAAPEAPLRAVFDGVVDRLGVAVRVGDAAGIVGGALRPEDVGNAAQRQGDELLKGDVEREIHGNIRFQRHAHKIILLAQTEIGVPAGGVGALAVAVPKKVEAVVVAAAGLVPVELLGPVVVVQRVLLAAVGVGAGTAVLAEVKHARAVVREGGDHFADRRSRPQAILPIEDGKGLVRDAVEPFLDRQAGITGMIHEIPLVEFHVGGDEGLENPLAVEGGVVGVGVLRHVRSHRRGVGGIDAERAGAAARPGIKDVAAACVFGEGPKLGGLGRILPEGETDVGALGGAGEDCEPPAGGVARGELPAAALLREVPDLVRRPREGALGAVGVRFSAVRREVEAAAGVAQAVVHLRARVGRGRGGARDRRGGRASGGSRAGQRTECGAPAFRGGLEQDLRAGNLAEDQPLRGGDEPGRLTVFVRVTHSAFSFSFICRGP